MHDRCGSYLEGNTEPDIMTYVRDSLRTLDTIKHNLSPQAMTIHEALLRCQEKEEPQEFIEHVYGLCCGYNL